jgi:general secretion pathway protein C
MVTNSQNKWWSRAITLVFWALAAASLAWWGLRLGSSAKPAQVALAPVAMNAEVSVDPAALARLLGAAAPSAAAPAPGAASRFALLGVVAGPSNKGAALIAVDGKPGRAYRVGSKIDEGVMLQSVEPRRALLGPTADASPSVILEMPLVRK